MSDRTVGRRLVGGEGADLDALGPDPREAEALEDGAGGAPELQRALGGEGGHDLRHDALVHVDAEVPHAGLLVVPVLEDLGLEPVEVRGPSASKTQIGWLVVRSISWR